MMEYWAGHFFLALMGILTGVVGSTLFHRYQYNKLKKKSVVAQLSAFHGEVRLILNESTKITKAVNSMLLHMHNGGPQIAAGVRQYSSVVDEAFVDDKYSVLEYWQEILIDVSYRDILRQLEEKRSVKLITGEMPDGILRRQYEQLGITASILFWVHESKGGPYYASFPSDAENPFEYVAGVDFAKLEMVALRPADASFDEVTDTICGVFKVGIVVYNTLEDGFQLQDILAAVTLEPTVREVINDVPAFLDQLTALTPTTAVAAITAAKDRINTEFPDAGKVVDTIFRILNEIALTYGFIATTAKEGVQRYNAIRSLLGQA